MGIPGEFSWKRIMYSRRLIHTMSVRAVVWLALALAAQVGPAVAAPREEYAVVLREAPLARHVSSRRELGSSGVADRASRIRRAQTALGAVIAALHIPVHGSAHLLVNALFVY